MLSLWTLITMDKLYPWGQAVEMDNVCTYLDLLKSGSVFASVRFSSVVTNKSNHLEIVIIFSHVCFHTHTHTSLERC